jgi:hypothetical protein
MQQKKILVFLVELNVQQWRTVELVSATMMKVALGSWRCEWFTS